MQNLTEILNGSVLGLLDPAGDGSATLSPLCVQKHYASTYEISCHLPFFDFNKSFAGFAILNIDRAALLDIWSHVLKMPDADLSMVREIAMEIVNMIVGNASEALSRHEFHVTLALPNIIEAGQQIQLSTLKRDDFHYFEYAQQNLKFNWVICMYDAISFARERRN